MTTQDQTHSRFGISNGVAGLVPVLLCVGLFALFAARIPDVSAGDAIIWSVAWVPSLDVTMSFLVDGLSLTFGLLITGIGALVMLYSDRYLAGHPHYARFALYLSAFMLSMLGLVLAGNLITLFVFWELTSVTSYLLIGFNNASAKSRRSALQALLVTGGGGLALLAGFILMAGVAGSAELSVVLTQGQVIQDHPLYLPILLLVLAGAFTKSAQIPFHFWLPNAMAAPTPVSAFLHSATMVKGGVYLMARLHPALGGTDVWLWTLTIAGSATAVFASILAVRQTDLKLALAYTTLMALGTLTLFLGASATLAITAAVTFLIVHSLYKAALFLVIGIVDHATGTREVDRLSGLARAMPLTAIAAAISALSMAGFPPLLGFIGKELKYKGALAVASEPVLVAAAVVLANALMFAVAAIVVLRPFFGPPAENRPRGEAPWQMWLGPLILGVGGVVLGIFPGLIGQSLVEPAVGAILAQPQEIELKLWHGVNLPLILSLVTFGLGIALFLVHGRLRAALETAERSAPNFDRGWDSLLDGLKGLAEWQTRVLQSGVLRNYTIVIFTTLLAGVGGTLVMRGAVAIDTGWPDAPVTFWAVIGLILAGALLTALAVSRILAVAALGAVGIGVALVFIMAGAPDVAITQLLVETLIVVLVAVVMLRLPLIDRRTANRPRDAVLAIGIGMVVGLTVLLATQGPLDRRLTDYFEVTSWPEAYGRNIVNVILVDFRALDTFGEIAVVVIAALAALALLRNRDEEKRP